MYPSEQLQSASVVLPGAELVCWGHTNSQEARPVRSSYLLASQAVHAEAASLLYVPAPHVTHSPVPSSLLNMPPAHAVQGPPSNPVNPGMQWHSSMESAPAAEEVAGGHARHVLCPVEVATAWYFPATHG